MPETSEKYELFLKDMSEALVEVIQKHDMSIPQIVQGMAELVCELLIETAPDDTSKEEVVGKADKLMEYLLRSLDLYRTKHQTNPGLESLGLANAIGFISYYVQQPEEFEQEAE